MKASSGKTMAADIENDFVVDRVANKSVTDSKEVDKDNGQKLIANKNDISRTNMS